MILQKSSIMTVYIDRKKARNNTNTQHTRPIRRILAAILSLALLLTFTPLSGMVSLTASALSPYGHQGSGTADDPYLIATAAQWKNFAKDMVNIETNNPIYGDKYYKLDADITVETDDTTAVFAGNSTCPFRGHFDGNGHTLTFNYNDNLISGAAPFRYVSGAVIENLKVAGTVRTIGSTTFHAGIAGYVTGNTTIRYCTVGSTLTGFGRGTGYFGGFAGSVAGGVTLTIYNCVFQGSLTGDPGFGCSGFVGYNLGTVDISDCLCAPTDTSNVIFYPFSLNRSGISFLNRAYRTTDYGITDQGTRVYSSVPDGQLTQRVTAADNNTYWENGTSAVNGIQAAYPLEGAALPLPVCEVIFNGVVLTGG